MQGARQKPIANRLLAALPRKTYQSLLAGFEAVDLEFGEDLYEAGGPISHVYFPNDCVVSLINMVSPDKGAEVGLVGNEGMVGIPIALGINVSSLRAVVQGTGTAMRMKASKFRTAFIADEALRHELFRFSHRLMSQISQTAACNQFHSVNSRLARWLLMTRDRLKSNEFRLTHEFLGKMLGVRRVGITHAASALQRQKLIGYSRGNITIHNPRGLQLASCSCYEVVKKLYA